MRNQIDKGIFDAYIAAGQMLNSLIRRIEEVDKLKKNHKAYLPAREELVRAARDYDEKLKELVRNMVRTIEKENNNPAPSDPWFATLHGDFVMLSFEMYRKLFDELRTICLTTWFYLNQTDGVDNESCHYQAIKDMLEILEQFREQWEKTEIYHWKACERNEKNAR